MSGSGRVATASGMWRAATRRLAPLIACWIATAWALAPAAGLASTPESKFDLVLPPGKLASALDALARATRLQILYDPKLVSERSTSGLTGSMTASEALERLLRQTGIVFTFTATDAVALYPQPERPKWTAHRVAFTGDRIPRLSPLTVTISARRNLNDGYGIADSSTALKVDTPDLLVPVASESLTQPLLRDRQANRLEDVLEDISTIEVVPSGESAMGFSIRGFPTYQYYVDGVRVSPDLHHDGFRDMADVERIDLIKGPASTLYGRTEPGGVINVITKQPLSTPYLSFEQQTGAFRYRRSQVDAGGPLLSDGTLLYRFNAAYESGNSYRDFLSNHRVFVAPVVTWKPSTRVQTTAYLEYLNGDDSNEAGLPIIGDQIPAVSVHRNLVGSAPAHTSDLRMGLRSSFAFSDQWSVRQHFDARWLRTPAPPQFALGDDGEDPSTCYPGSCPVNRLLVWMPVSKGKTYFGSLELLGKLDTGPLHHAVLFGTEMFEVHGRYATLSYEDPSLSIDLFNPRYGPVDPSLLQSPSWRFAVRSAEQWTGAYFQDQISFGEHWHLLLGGRYDHVRESLRISYTYPSPDWNWDNREVRWDNAFKQREGLVWSPTRWLSAYASYTENFGIATGIYNSSSVQQGGLLLPPESAHEWEVGVKMQLAGGRLVGSLAWFDLTKLNIATPSADPTLAAQGVRTVTGAARNRGLEIDLHGEILPSLEVIASYAYIDSRIVGDADIAGYDLNNNPILSPGNQGNRFFGVPLHGGSLWLAYQSPFGLLRGLKLGAGVLARTVREGDNANQYELPGFARWDGLVSYSWRAADTRFSVQLNIDNVFNARYFESLGGRDTVVPGAPRTWLASMRVEL